MVVMGFPEVGSPTPSPRPFAQDEPNLPSLISSILQQISAIEIVQKAPGKRQKLPWQLREAWQDEPSESWF
jgi:hypothetical protein